MTWLWTVLGALLLTVVLAVCITYFIVRPMLAKRVNVASQAVSRELYGRPPLMSSAASCEGVTDPNRLGLRGVGVLALSENALVFASGKTEESVIVPRSNVTLAEPVMEFEALGKHVRRPRPMLAVSWQDGRDQAQRVAFTVDDAAQWVAALPQM